MALVEHITYISYRYLIPHNLGVPWVTFTDCVEPWNVRVPYLPSFVPIKLVPYSERMCFTERLINTLLFVGIKSCVEIKSCS